MKFLLFLSLDLQHLNLVMDLILLILIPPLQGLVFLMNIPLEIHLALNTGMIIILVMHPFIDLIVNPISFMAIFS